MNHSTIIDTNIQYFISKIFSSSYTIYLPTLEFSHMISHERTYVRAHTLTRPYSLTYTYNTQYPQNAHTYTYMHTHMLTHTPCHPYSLYIMNTA